jgi:hypothetical protein
LLARGAQAFVSALEGHARQSLGGLDAINRPDPLDHDVADCVEGVGLDLRNEVVFSKKRIEFNDLGELQEDLVDLLLPIWFDVD